MDSYIHGQLYARQIDRRLKETYLKFFKRLAYI